MRAAVVRRIAGAELGTAQVDLESAAHGAELRPRDGSKGRQQSFV